MKADLLFLLALGAAGCSSGGSGQSLQTFQQLQGSVTSCEFTTSSQFPSTNPAPPVHVNLTDATTARSLYGATLAVPPLASGTYACPIDYLVTYHVAFRDSSGADVATVDLDPGGCEPLNVQTAAGSSVQLSAMKSAGYWSTLAADLGVHESAIYPYVPPPSGDAGTD